MLDFTRPEPVLEAQVSVWYKWHKASNEFRAALPIPVPISTARDEPI